MADARDELTVINVGGQTSIDLALGWHAHTVYCENYTNQYVSLPDIVSFIPPYTARLLALPGVQKAKMLFAAPPGLNQVASISGQVCTATWSERSVPVTGGPIGPIGVTSNYYDRNPLSFNLAFGATAVAPHAATVRASYLAPANRKAFIELMSSRVILDTIPGDLVGGNAQTFWRFTPVGGVTRNLLNAEVFGLAPVRSTGIGTLGASIEMQSGDLIEGVTLNVYTATTTAPDLTLKGTEFDA